MLPLCSLELWDHPSWTLIQSGSFLWSHLCLWFCSPSSLLSSRSALQTTSSFVIIPFSSISWFHLPLSHRLPPSTSYFYLTYPPASSLYHATATSTMPSETIFLLKSLRHYSLFTRIKSKLQSLPTTDTITYSRHIEPYNSLIQLCFPSVCAFLMPGLVPEYTSSRKSFWLPQGKAASAPGL